MKKRLLFITPSLSSFNRQDVEILSKHFKVDVWCDPWRKKFLVPWLLLLQCCRLLYKLPSKDVVLISFASYWSMLPTLYGKLLGKPVYIILHGTDACKFDEINYGNLRKPLLRYFIKVSVKNATELFPVSESLIETKNSYFRHNKDMKFGLLNEFPNLKTPFKTIPNGFNLSFWQIDQLPTRQPKTLITVASETQHMRKGIDLIIKAASKLPSFEFVIVGSKKTPLNLDVPSNVIFLGRIDQAELKKRYFKTQFYLQLSVFEGFGCALAEAMLCGCVPIGSNVNAIPEIIGDCGYVLYNHQVEDFVELLNIASSSPDLNSLSEKARKRITANYPISNRESLMLNELSYDR